MLFQKTVVRGFASVFPVVLRQVVNDGYIGQGNPAPTNTSTRHLNVDRALGLVPARVLGTLFNRTHVGACLVPARILRTSFNRKENL